MSDIKIIATGDKWIGKGVKNTLSTVKKIIDNTEDSLILTVYIISETSILEHIKKALERGIRIDIFICGPENENKSIMSNILELEMKYNYLNVFRVYDAVLHAKVMVSDYKKVLIGSANLTRWGLVKNYELGILIDDSDVALKIGSTIKRLIE